MIHDTAIVGDEVELGQDVSIGPYTVIEGQVTIGDGCRIGPHCHIRGTTTIGAHTRIHKSAVIGDDPQDHSFDPASESFCDIGEHCLIREFVTIHRGTKEQSRTTIGDHCMLMAFAHIAHNCQVAERVVIANGSILAGYVEVGERAFISANASVHQFVHVGSLSMLAHHIVAVQDVTPYTMVANGRGVAGPNVVGLRRAGFDTETRTAIKRAIRLLHHSGKSRDQAVAEIQATCGDSDAIRHFLEFIENSTRGLLTGRG